MKMGVDDFDQFIEEETLTEEEVQDFLSKSSE